MKDKAQAHRDAVAKYAKSKKAFTIRVEPTEYEKIVSASKQARQSTRSYILQAVREKMERDAQAEPPT